MVVVHVLDNYASYTDQIETRVHASGKFDLIALKVKSFSYAEIQ